MATILANVEATSSQFTPASWADVLALTSGPVTVASTASIIILIATVPIRSDVTAEIFDKTPEFRFAVDGVREGPQITAFKDQVDEVTSLASLLHILTGISGSHTFSLQWQIVESTPETDTSRTRNLQVIEIP
jgi:hypothetical protein